MRKAIAVTILALVGICFALLPIIAVGQQGALGKPWRRQMQTRDLHTVYCNMCEALNATPTPAIGVTVLRTPTVVGTSPTPTPDTSPEGIVIQSGVDYCPSGIPTDPNACPIVSSGTMNCVKLRLQPSAGVSPATALNGTIMQITIGAQAVTGDYLSCDLRLDVLNTTISPN